MSDETRSFTFEQTVPAPPAALYRAFTNGSALREWLCDVATTVPRKGGRCYLAWNDGYYSSGEFTRLVPDEEVAFTWHGRGEPAATAVHVTLVPADDTTRVRVTHNDLGTGPDWAEITPALEQAWPFNLRNLASVFTSGADLRFTERPMLGIGVGDFNTTIAALLGVPTSDGVLVDDVLPEMGAGAAGLQENDVIVAIADQKVSDWATLAHALQGYRPGDEVEVDFYRGPDRRQVRMTLSGRPIPAIPSTIDALTALIRERYERIDDELATFFADVGEVRAAHKPAAEAWSVREILAHLIHSERDTHSWMADMVGGHERWYDDWGGNLQARIDATLAAFPTVDELLEELRRLNVETVAFVSSLPASFLERKGSYWRLAYQLLEPPYHHHTHLEQMREALDAAG